MRETTSIDPSGDAAMIRSLAHRLAGDELTLPVEGRMSGAIRCRDRVAELRAADARRAFVAGSSWSTSGPIRA